jgi:hypothetical protein
MGIPKYQDIIDLLQHGLTIEAREKILELREAAMQLQEENLALKEQLKQIEADSDLSRAVRFEKGVYWLDKPTDDGVSLQGPYCQVCYDRDRRLVRLQRNNAPGGGWHCAACHARF